MIQVIKIKIKNYCLKIEWVHEIYVTLTINLHMIHLNHLFLIIFFYMRQGSDPVKKNKKKLKNNLLFLKEK